MTDTAIEHSPAFTITGDPIILALILPTPHHLRVTPPASASNSGSFDILMDFTLAIIPNNFSPEQIRSLSDVETVGGKIVRGAKGRATASGAMEWARTQDRVRQIESGYG